MVSTSGRNRPSFLSTAVVSKALGLEPSVVRARIDIGELPEPQWITFGSRVERVYSLEWLLLASDRLNRVRLSGLEQSIGTDDLIQCALRFEQDQWTVAEISQKLAALDGLWNLCARTLATDEETQANTLKVRRLSAGSPLDLLLSIDPALGIPIAGATAVFVYVLRNPAKVGEAIPSILTAWRQQWAKADEAKIDQLSASLRAKAFQREASRLLGDLDAVPSESSVSLPDARVLQLMSSPDSPAALDQPHTAALPVQKSQELDENDGGELRQ